MKSCGTGSGRACQRWSLNGQWCILKCLAQTGCWCRSLHSGIWTSYARNLFAPGFPLAFVHRWKQARGWLNVWQHMWKSLNSLSTPCQWHGGKSCRMTCDGLGLARGRVGMEGGRPSLTLWALPENSYSSAVKLRSSFCFNHKVRLNIIAGNSLWVWVIKKHLQCQ